MKKTAKVEIIAVGNEILTGDILDTNSNWLCTLVHSHGGEVRKVTVIPDQLDIIAQSIRQALQNSVDLIVLSGGLGPTSDDLTLQAVSLGTDRELKLHPEAREMIRRQYDCFHAQGIMAQGGLNPAREKMAWLPQGAEPLINSVGTAPGVFLELGATALVCVPGVPSELKAIFTESLDQYLNQLFGKGEALSRSLSVKCNDESQLEPLLTRIAHTYPDIYTKSLATTIGETPEMKIIMTIAGIGEMERQLTTAFDELCQGIIALGFSIVQMN